jgi:hypothetical protein
MSGVSAQLRNQHDGFWRNQISNVTIMNDRVWAGS